MPIIHDQIDEVLAAAVHNELTDDERRALHVHLVECAECRALHKEEQLMNKALGEVFTDENRISVSKNECFTHFAIRLRRARASRFFW